MPELCVDTRTICGAFSVDECARRISHYRYAEKVSMTTLGAWASTTPSVKAKFAFGEFCYHDSIHFYWLGQRLPELRQVEGMDLEEPPTLRASALALPPNPEFEEFVEEMQLQDDELLRVVGLFRILKTHLAVYYRHHLAVTDPICDGPTVRILSHVLLEEEEHIKWGQAFYEEMADTPEKRRRALEWQMHLEDLLARSGGITGGK
jgi:hypothetical protein